MSGKRVLVTGGAGFIGSNLVAKLVERGDTVTVLDDFSTGTLDNLTGLEYQLHRGNVVDANIVNALVKRVDIVYHLAVRNIIASTHNPRSDFEVNIGGTLNVLLAARESGARVVYTSSASIYGDSRTLPITEDCPPMFLSPYAASKYAGEAYCQVFYEMWHVPVTVLRLSNVYGRNQHPINPYCGVVSKFMSANLSDAPMQIHGDGNQTRDYTYIDDAIDAIVTAGESERAIGQTLNIASGVETSVNALAQMIIDAGYYNGKSSKPVHIERRDIDNVRRRVLNVERARRVLGWEPSTSLRDGLIKTFEWMLNSGDKSTSLH